MKIIEITQNVSACCNAPVHIKKVIDGLNRTEDPFCSACLGFPPLSESGRKRLRMISLIGISNFMAWDKYVDNITKINGINLKVKDN